jgi:hypothetical protein
VNVTLREFVAQAPPHEHCLPRMSSAKWPDFHDVCACGLQLFEEPPA